MNIEVLIARIDERLKGMESTMDAIHEQTTKTNGRVNKLESWKSEHLIERETQKGKDSVSIKSIKTMLAIHAVAILLLVAISSPKLFNIITSAI